jgi:hypothetical protein
MIIDRVPSSLDALKQLVGAIIESVWTARGVKTLMLILGPSLPTRMLPSDGKLHLEELSLRDFSSSAFLRSL